MKSQPSPLEHLAAFAICWVAGALSTWVFSVQSKRRGTQPGKESSHG